MKRKLYLLTAIVLLAFTAFLFTGCFTTGTAAVRLQNEGTFGQHTRTPVKDFVTVGLVFTENQVLITADVIEGEIFTYNALLKEAQKLEADAIINVVIDKKIELVKSGLNTFEKETWYGSALAVKYTDTLRQTVTVITDPNTGATTTVTEQVFLNDADGTVQPKGGNTPAADEQPEKSNWRDRFRK